MRLADFILANVEPILAEWEAFARGIWPGAATDPATLRDHAEEILRAIAADMVSAQTSAQQCDKAKGEGKAGTQSDRVDRASARHGVDRVRWGFDVQAVVSEYRALRASVVRLWQDACAAPDRVDVRDLTRFDESLDQSLAEAVRGYGGEVERARQIFLAVLGHDLRTPLAAVMLLSKVMGASGRLDAESARMASDIADSAGAMSKMVADLLDFTGTGLGVAMRLSPAPTDLRGVCEEVVAEVRAAHPTCLIQFQSHGDLTVDADAGRVRQMVANLVNNAVQHGDASCPVELSVSTHGDHAAIAVRNAGPPIPPAVLPTIFEPLVRGGADRPSQRRSGSIGLGLYIAREVATAHGGRIAVESSAAAGTVFTVSLPRRRAAR